MDPGVSHEGWVFPVPQRCDYHFSQVLVVIIAIAVLFFIILQLLLLYVLLFLIFILFYHLLFIAIIPTIYFQKSITIIFILFCIRHLFTNCIIH